MAAIVADVSQVINAVLAPVNTLMLLSIIFYAGRKAEQIEAHERRLDLVEKDIKSILGEP